MLREIVIDVLADVPGLELVDDVGHADVLVSGGENDVSIRSLLSEHPRLRLIAICGDGRQSFVWMMRPHRTPLGELSRATLLAGIRAEGP